MSYDSHGFARPEGREHIPIFPKNFVALRIVQLVLSVIVLALSAYGVAAGYAANGIVYILAVALMTWITSIYHIVAELGAPKIYNYWAVLSLDIFMVLMWLCSFALLASAVAIWASFTDTYYVGFYLYEDGYSKAWIGALAGAAAIGAIEFVLHIVTLAYVGAMLHRHRAAGLHSMPGVERTVPGATDAPVTTFAQGPTDLPHNIAGTEKMEPVYVQTGPAPPMHPQGAVYMQQPGQPQMMPQGPVFVQQQQPGFQPYPQSTSPAPQGFGQVPVQPTPYYPPQQGGANPILAQHTGEQYVHHPEHQQQQQQQPPLPLQPQQPYQEMPYQMVAPGAAMPPQ